MPLIFLNKATNVSLLQIVDSEDGRHSTLILRMYNKDALGEYKCTVNNTVGEVSVVFHVTLGVKPDPPDFVSRY